MPEKKTKKCPLCGEEIPVDADICPHCGANLELFEEDIYSEEDESKTVLESFLDSIGDADDVDPEKLIEEMKKLVGGTTEEGGEESEIAEHEEEEIEVPKAEEGQAGITDHEEEESEEDEVEEEVEYVCPVCGKPVGPDDKICPHCGAIFVESDEELEELLEEQLEEAKELIKTMRAKKIDVSDVTPFLKNANIAKRKGDIDSALENAIECVDRAKKRLQTPSNSS